MAVSARLLYNWLRAVFADSIYNRLAALLACFLAGLVLIIVRRLAGTTGFVVQPRRWVVERSLGWFGRWRRLSKDYEALPEVSEAMVTLAMIRLMLHRLVHPNRRRLPALTCAPELVPSLVRELASWRRSGCLESV
jgi:putative transposase